MSALLALLALGFDSSKLSPKLLALEGPTGVLATTLAGMVFCILYVVTGSLLVPIALHSLIDLRFVVLPAARPRR